MKLKEFIVPIILGFLTAYFTFTLIRIQGGTGMIREVEAPVEFNQQDRRRINEIHRFLIEGFE